MNDNSPRLLRRLWGRLFGKRIMPRYLFGLACLATLIGLFYAVEDWRGKRAWEKCRRELEAKGAVLDWDAYIPAPVPDEQNIFKAPKMTEWFVKEPWNAAAGGGSSKTGNTNAPFGLLPGWNIKRPPTLLVEVSVVLPGGPLPAEKADAVLRLGDAGAREEAAKLIHERVGACTEDFWIGLAVAQPLDQIHPLHLVLQADTMPTPNALTEFLSCGAATNQAGATPSQKYLQAERFGSQAFHVSLTPAVRGAAEYLAVSESAVPDLDLLRKALQRPYARIHGNYSRPYESPIPDFVRLRMVAQMLSRRAKCYLLLGQSGAAWHELELIRDMCRMLDAKPASNGSTLVATMIDVAITGLYVSIIQDGLRLHGWREPELVAMQKQLMEVNLLPLIRDSFSAQRAALCRLFETDVLAEFKKWLNFGVNPPGLWERLKNPRNLFGWLMPRGWIYQNMCAFAIRGQLAIESLDIPDNRVLPRNAEKIDQQMHAAFSDFAPYTFMGRSIMPNFIKATSTTARNQTLVNEAYIACGLERYRLAHGQYPESLEALVPQYAEKLPHDIIGGQPLHYHRTADGRFVLYSLGWNATDDGGIESEAGRPGDWVWE
jgi:hypothetical protein